MVSVISAQVVEDLTRRVTRRLIFVCGEGRLRMVNRMLRSNAVQR